MDTIPDVFNGFRELSLSFFVYNVRSKSIVTKNLPEQAILDNQHGIARAGQLRRQPTYTRASKKLQGHGRHQCHQKRVLKIIHTVIV
jgi:hypothetical protein